MRGWAQSAAVSVSTGVLWFVLRTRTTPSPLAGDRGVVPADGGRVGVAVAEEVDAGAGEIVEGDGAARVAEADGAVGLEVGDVWARVRPFIGGQAACLVSVPCGVLGDDPCGVRRDDAWCRELEFRLGLERLCGFVGDVAAGKVDGDVGWVGDGDELVVDSGVCIVVGLGDADG